MKTLKKISAWLMAFVFVTCMMGTSVFAAGGNKKPTEADTATITINGIEGGATVTAYKIVTATYNTTGFTGYEKVDGIGTLDSITEPSSEQIATIAQTIAEKAKTNDEIKTVKLDRIGENTYQATVTAGSWLVVVTDTDGTTIYNPMLLSAVYNKDGSATSNSLSDSSINTTDHWSINGSEGYVKSSTPSVDKKIAADDTLTNHNDVAVGDQVYFQIKSTMPSYSSQYDKVVVNVNDTLSKGLSYYVDETGADDVIVMVGGKEVTRGTDYTLNPTSLKDSKTMSVQFTSDFIKANGNKTIAISYSAILNENAGVNFDANTNTAYMDYSNNPSKDTTGKTQDSKNYVYTFGLDASLCGTFTSVTGNRVTHELIKVNQDATEELIKSWTTEEELQEALQKYALSGATFALKQGDKVIKTAVSDEKGYLNFTGLDAGTYTLVETQAPAGYTLDASEHTVVIAADYNDDGTLHKYTVTVDGHASSYTATYDRGVVTEIKDGEEGTETTYIKNTKIGELPSTGGMGTYLFTIAGVTLMAAAVVMLAMSRRNKVTDTK